MTHHMTYHFYVFKLCQRLRTAAGTLACSFVNRPVTEINE